MINSSKNILKSTKTNEIEQNYNKDTIKQLDNITKSVIGTSQNRKLSDDLTLISIGK